MSQTIHATTILTIKKDDKIVLIADGQVTAGSCVMKSNANKLRELSGKKNSPNKNQEDYKVLVGFAGTTADAMTLFELLESKLDKHPEQLKKACVELTKDCRGNKILRHLEAMMIVVDQHHSLIITGNGDVFEPEERIAAIGSGGNYALAAALALAHSDSKLDAEEIAHKSMKIAADLCIYTNHNNTIKTLVVK